MSSEERTTWVFGIVAALGYAGYLVWIFATLGGRPLDSADYTTPLIASIAIAAFVPAVVATVTAIVTRERGERDQRDREIGHLGDRVGGAFVAAGAVGALLLALSEAATFWIANTIYLAFILAAVVSSIAKLVAYRRGVPRW